VQGNTESFEGLDWQFIILHHSATSTMTTFEEIRQDHLRRGWTDIGYHFVIDRKGDVHNGRPVDIEGAHCVDPIPGTNISANQLALGICFIGDYSQPYFYLPSHEALETGIKLIFELLEKKFRNCEVWRVIPHWAISRTFCPGPLIPIFIWKGVIYRWLRESWMKRGVEESEGDQADKTNTGDSQEASYLY